MMNERDAEEAEMSRWRGELPKQDKEEEGKEGEAVTYYLVMHYCNFITFSSNW